MLVHNALRIRTDLKRLFILRYIQST